MTLADIDGPGVIQSVWMTTELGRDLILRLCWEGKDQPSVECPLPDFFAVPWSSAGRGTMPTAPFAQLTSMPVAVNPYFGLNCFWEMLFRQHCRITAENLLPRGDVYPILDGDAEFPTIYGTGLGNYYGDAWDWEVDKQYRTYTTPFPSRPPRQELLV